MIEIRNGDHQLASELRAMLGSRHPVAAAAEVSPAGIRMAGLGAGLSADFEIGSISKAITGFLYARARDGGEIDGATTLGELLPVTDTPLAS